MPPDAASQKDLVMNISHVLFSPYAVGALVTAISFGLLYRLAVPRPLPGIPHNAAATHNLFGDVPAMQAHVNQACGNSIVTYLLCAVRALNAPLVQLFLGGPMSKPLVILSDFHEMQDIMTNRTKEFDRSPTTGLIVKGLGPNHHIHLRTTPQWLAQRRLTQDLMTPTFFNNIAGPTIHKEASKFVSLWLAKARLANGRPWDAETDLHYASWGAVMSFAFGDRFSTTFEHSSPCIAEKPHVMSMKNDDFDGTVQFTEPEVSELLRAMLELMSAPQKVHGSPLPELKWKYVGMTRSFRRANKIKTEFIRKALIDAVRLLEKGASEEWVKCAVDHMVCREKALAAKDRRQPDYTSGIMIDEIFGFIVGGADTTSAAMAWGLKFLASNTDAQRKLRLSLEEYFPAAKSLGRNPTIQEITSVQIPYLEATIQEMARCACAIPLIYRESVVDTQLLGCRIPKGTLVGFLQSGPSMMSPAFAIDEEKRKFHGKATNKSSQRRGWEVNDMASYNPDRWLVSGDKGYEFNGTAGPQMAWGAGPRQCQGKRLSLLEMRILITLLVWNLEFLPCPPALGTNEPALVLANRPKKCYVRLQEVNRERKV
ncbi:hypothetical protein N0V93_001424 [Gnomoniopsis smithogilvyi]|uniref:Cytochrome P450 n=1 Tax=Gnomoniopsis smithogilvyi TaxID=1191159 RepID=A0A9W8Z3P1_9PEZI|nr:hypothetical protein N0V93_001424 [Gnomoniopsis smithogilvyi]